MVIISLSIKNKVTMCQDPPSKKATKCYQIWEFRVSPLLVGNEEIPTASLWEANPAENPNGKTVPSSIAILV